MFLRSLTMKGFKSFADPTVLELQPGITVVVGPNGSGKSNVVDAVTWVLGAQGPRTLRSQKMEDVIFAGTSSRPALGRAEVSLTIDNTSGLLPLDMAEVTITRTLFRSGDSEYAINGTPCRLLDVQELLSDSGVGRQQHMIIGQGQLDRVLSARPEDRRAVIEEAAGVLKHRRRRERAERRLAGTEENLERLGDLVREVKRQIRPLERQAAAARSHVALRRELMELRLHLAGRELAELADRHQAASDERARLAADERALHQQLAQLDAEATKATAELSARHHDDTAAGLARSQALSERARGLEAVLRERQRSLRAGLDAAADEDVVSTLEAEAAHLAEELAATDTVEAELDQQRTALEGDERRATEAEEREAAELAGSPQPEQAAEAVRRAFERQEMLRRTVEQHERVRDAVAERETSLLSRRQDLLEADQATTARLEELAAARPAVEAQAVQARRDAEVAARRTALADQAARVAEQEHQRAAARAEALRRALEEVRQQPARQTLAGATGVLGALADLIEVEAGWEAAFEAVVAGAEAAVVVDRVDAGRRAMGTLHDRGVTGAVLVASTSSAPDIGVDLPPDASSVRRHVRPRPGATVGVALDGLLDRLLTGAVRVSTWQRAADLALAHPDLVVVTEAGDRFSREGWRIRRGPGVVTAVAVEAAVEQARAGEETARVRAAELVVARDAGSGVDAALAEARERLAQLQSAVSSLEEERTRTSERLQQVDADVAAAGSEAKAAGERRQVVEAELDEVQASIPGLQRQAEEASEIAARLQQFRDAWDAARSELRRRRQAHEVAGASLAERRRVLARRRDEMERRLEGHAEERRLAEARRRGLERDLTAVRQLEGLVRQQGERLEAVTQRLSEAYRQQVEAARAGGERLDVLHRQRLDAERRLEDLRGGSRRVDLELAELALRAGTLSETVRSELESEPETAVTVPCPALPDGVTPERHAEALSERLASLGPINPLALDELSELESRAAELDAQVSDIRSARRELQQVIRYLDEQIMQTFSSAVADVNEHFSTLATTLFPGGTGRLTLSDPENLLETGVEIELRPVGRNVRRISLLSGGERSLVALAFLFAVFRSRPSPFYLMDEVEAALDDVNLHRFLGLVRSFRDEAQLIIVSHQKRTMETADALYGVTMAPGGSSQVVSQRVADHRSTEAPGALDAGAGSPDPDGSADSDRGIASGGDASGDGESEVAAPSGLAPANRVTL